MITSELDRAIARADIVALRRRANAQNRLFNSNAKRRKHDIGDLERLAEAESETWDRYAEACDRL